MNTEADDSAFGAWAEAMHAEYDAFLRQSWAAMRAARRGHWIEDTEERVRQAGIRGRTDRQIVGPPRASSESDVSSCCSFPLSASQSVLIRSDG